MRARSQRQGRAYAAIPNAAMRDTRLSAEARGLLAYLMTFSDEWRFYRVKVMQDMNLKKTRYDNVMRELKDCGYIGLVTATGDKGLDGKTWVIRDDPGSSGVRDDLTSALDDDQVARRSGKPTIGETDHIRKPILKENQPKEETQTLSSDFPKQKAKRSEAENDQFPEFWDAFPDCPRKTDQAQARALFRQIIEGRHKTIARTDPAVIIAGIKAYAASGPDPMWVCMPKTWLKGERWTQCQADTEVSAERARLRAITENARAASRQH